MVGNKSFYHFFRIFFVENINKQKFILCLSLLFFILQSISLGNSKSQEYDNILPVFFYKAKNTNIEFSLKMFNYLVENEISFEKLTNPQFLTENEILKRIDECRIIEQNMRKLDVLFRMISESYQFNKEDIGSELSILKQKNEILYHAVNYILFAKRWSGENLYNIANKIILKIPTAIKSEDRSFIIKKTEKVYYKLNKKWKNLGLDIPKGYIYIRVFSTLERMRNEFSLGENVHGATFPCRYVAIPYDQGRIKFKYTLSHELVHVFANVILGYKNRTKISLWIEEGLATYLSKDPGTHLVSCKVLTDQYGNRITQDIYSTTSKDYMKWKSYIEYIISSYGRDKFGELFRDIIINASISKSLNNILSVQSETAFIQNADNWLKKKETLKFIMILFGLIGIFGFLIASMKNSFIGIIVGIIILIPSFAISFTEYFRYTTVFPFISLSVIIIFILLIFITLISRRGEETTERDYFVEDEELPEEMSQSQLEVQERSLRELIRLEPYNSFAHDSLGTILHNQGRYEDAEEEYLIAIRLDPKNPRYHANFAGNLFLRGETEKAYNEAIYALRLGFNEDHWVFQHLGIEKEDDSK